MPKYQWPSPHAWLMDRVSAEAGDRRVDWLEQAILAMAACLDSDQIEDIFEIEMEQDGYFEPLDVWETQEEVRDETE